MSIYLITPNVALGSSPAPDQITDTIQTDRDPTISEAPRAPGWNMYADRVAWIRQAVARGGKVLVTSTSGSAQPEAIVYAYLRAEGALPEGAWSTIHAAYPAAVQTMFPQADAAMPLIPQNPVNVHPVGPVASTNVWGILGTGLLVYVGYKLFFGGARANPSDTKNIKLPRGVVTELFNWHGGQFTPTYALASTGMNGPVSLEMIEDAESELARALKKVREPKDAASLRSLIKKLASYSRQAD